MGRPVAPLAESIAILHLWYCNSGATMGPWEAGRPPPRVAPELRAKKTWRHLQLLIANAKLQYEQTSELITPLGASPLGIPRACKPKGPNGRCPRGGVIIPSENQT